MCRREGLALPCARLIGQEKKVAGLWALLPDLPAGTVHAGQAPTSASPSLRRGCADVHGASAAMSNGVLLPGQCVAPELGRGSSKARLRIGRRCKRSISPCAASCCPQRLPAAPRAWSWRARPCAACEAAARLPWPHKKRKSSMRIEICATIAGCAATRPLRLPGKGSRAMAHLRYSSRSAFMGAALRGTGHTSRGAVASTACAGLTFVRGTSR